MTTATEEILETGEQTQELEIPNILRTRRDGVWEVYNGPWGSYLRATDDPDANVEITDDHLKKFELKEDIRRIPAELWAKWVKLCFYYVDKVSSSVEVSVRILRSEEDPSQYRFLVPRQKVSGASVRVENFDEAIDIDTGEEITQYPPAGWIPVGSSHSHNTMQAFFSGVDDKYELDDPGVHLVVGSIDTKNMKYMIAASVVGSRRRFTLPYDKLIDATPIEGMNFHPKVIDYVDYTSPIATVTKGNFVSYPSSWVKKETKDTSSIKSDYNDLSRWGWDGYDDGSDPFYWSNSYSNSETRTVNKDTQLWNVVDLLNDYTTQNGDDLEKLISLQDHIRDFLNDLEISIDDYIEKYSERQVY